MACFPLNWTKDGWLSKQGRICEPRTTMETERGTARLLTCPWNLIETTLPGPRSCASLVTLRKLTYSCIQPSCGPATGLSAWSVGQRSEYQSPHAWGSFPGQVCFKSLQSCLTFCHPVDCSLPGSSVHGILQARILKWVAMSSSRECSQPRDQTCISSVSRISRRVLYLLHLLVTQPVKCRAGSPDSHSSV